MELQQECIDGLNNTSCKATLEWLFRTFPHCVTVNRDGEGKIVLSMLRAQLIKEIDQHHDKRQVIFTSFERGLKHAGMEVIQTTHGEQVWKKWAFKQELNKKDKKKRQRESSAKPKHDDDDYVLPPRKLKRRIELCAATTEESFTTDEVLFFFDDNPPPPPLSWYWPLPAELLDLPECCIDLFQ